LHVSGLLNPVIGGKSIKPPQPPGVSELAYASSVKWKESQGSDRYRRGLYIHFQRTVPYPQLMNFDAPDANTAACRRDRSTTPLQALNLLNDPVFVEAAQALSARVLREAPSAKLEDRLAYAFELSLSRPPSAGELQHLLDYYRQQSAIFERDPTSAAKLGPDSAWTGVASVLLNLDEFIRRE
jgi:hypothetical protein